MSPVPRLGQRFWRCSNRWMTISRHPGPVCRAHPAFRAGDHDLRRSFRLETPPAVSPADTLTRLGPCSLAPAALFGARLTSVFETRCRLPTSATTLRRAGNQTRALVILAGTEALTSFRFFRATSPPCDGSDTGQAAQRPTKIIPVLVRSRRPGLPNHDTFSAASPPGLRHDA